MCKKCSNNIKGISVNIKSRNNKLKVILLIIYQHIRTDLIFQKIQNLK